MVKLNVEIKFKFKFEIVMTLLDVHPELWPHPDHVLPQFPPDAHTVCCLGPAHLGNKKKKLTPYYSLQ